MHHARVDVTRPQHLDWPKIGLAALLVGIGLALCIASAQAEGTGAIWGRVTYVGGVPGEHPIQVCLSGGAPDPYCLLPNDGNYVFDALADGDYTVQAWVNVYTDSDVYWDDAVEAWYDPDADGQPDTVTVSGGSVSGIDISVGGPWIPLNGPELEGGWVDILGVDAAHADVVYACVAEPYSSGNGKVFKSTDGGTTWTAVYTPSVPVYDLAARGNKVCLSGARGDETVLMCSDDAGGTWKELDAIMPGYLVQAFDITISAEPSSTLLLAGRVVTITDGSAIEDIDLTYGLPAVLSGTIGGDSWEPVLERPSNEGERTAFYAIAEHPSMPGRFFVGGDDAWVDFYSVPAGSIYRVEDGNWAGATQVYTATEPGPVLSLAIDPTTGRDVVLASTLLEVLRSADGGDTWEEVPDQQGGEHLAFSPAGDAYLATPNGTVYTSTDGGEMWDDGVSLDDFCNDLAAGANLYAGGCTDGVLRSTDGGATWAPSNEGITSLVSLRSLAVDPFDQNRMYAAAEYSGGWRSADGGATWALDLDGYVGAYACHPWKQGVVYRGVRSTSQGSLERSADGGEHWEVVYTSTTAYADPPTEGVILAVAPAPSWPSTVYAGGYDKPGDGGLLDRHAVIARSAQDGVAGSWVEKHHMAAGSWVEALAVHPTNPDVAYAGGTHEAHQGFVKRTVDGDTWSTVFTDTQPVKSIAIDRRDPLAVYVGTAAERIFRSVDGGDTWAAVRLPASEGGGASGSLVVADPRAPGRVYLAGYGTVLESADRGDTWIEQYSVFAPAPQQSPEALAVVNHGDLQTLYFSGEGLWSFTRANPWPESSLFVPAVMNAAP
jgi:photosystem II stability/assembly factor-like uncharacterized protein